MTKILNLTYSHFLIKLNLCDKFFHRLMRSRCSQIKIEHFHARFLFLSVDYVAIQFRLTLVTFRILLLFHFSFAVSRICEASHYFHSTFDISPFHDCDSSLSLSCSRKSGKHKDERGEESGWKFMTSKQNVENIYDRVFVFRLNFNHLFTPSLSLTLTSSHCSWR